MDSLGQQLSALQVLLALLALALGSVIVVYTLISGGSVPREGTETTGQLGARRKVVLAIAHPDDECMFFGPTLTTCKDAEWTVLCFSTGLPLIPSCAALIAHFHSDRERGRVRRDPFRGTRKELCGTEHPIFTCSHL